MNTNEFLAGVMRIVTETKNSPVWKMFETKFANDTKKEKFVELVSSKVFATYKKEIVANPAILDVTKVEIESYVKMNF